MSTRWLLDTNVVSQALRGRAPQAVERLRSLPREQVGISVITAMDLAYGVARRPDASRLRSTLERFLEVVPTLALPEGIVESYAGVRVQLERPGRPIGALDTILAAHALAIGATFVTNNLREFTRVEGLRCEDWSGG